MDELCEQLEYMVPLHDPTDEYKLLRFSRNITIDQLSTDPFLYSSFTRYKRYFKYIDFLIYGEKGRLILILINEFLQYETLQCNNLFLAAKCIVIDSKIYKLFKKIEEVEMIFSDDEAQEYDSY